MIKIYSKYLDIVVDSPIINAFKKTEIQNFLSSGKFKIISYKKNCVIHFDGEPCNNLEIIIKGKVVVERIDDSGDLLTISHFSDGDILGGNLMFSSNPLYLMTVTAIENCDILVISRDFLFHLLSTNKEFLLAYLEFVSDLTSLLGNKIKYHLKQSLRDSILNYLNQEYKIQNSLKIKLPMSKKILAETLGVQRTSLSRELKKMENDGLLLFDSKYITIIDIDIIKKK